MGDVKGRMVRKRERDVSPLGDGWGGVATSDTRLPTRPREPSPVWSPLKGAYPLRQAGGAASGAVAIMDIFATLRLDRGGAEIRGRWAIPQARSGARGDA